MNRRNAISAVLGLAGAGAVLKEVPAEPKPLCFILEAHGIEKLGTYECPVQLTAEAANRIVFEWKRAWEEDRQKAPLLLIPPSGFSLKAIGQDSKEYADLAVPCDIEETIDPDKWTKCDHGRT